MSIPNTDFGSTIATDPLRSFRFYAEFHTPDEGVTGAQGALSKKIVNGWVGGFASIDGLNINTQAIPYREGGFNTTVHQIPGMTTFQPVTFSRGVLAGNDQAMTWMRGMFAAAAGNGLASSATNSFRVNIIVYVQNHPNAGTTNTDKMAFKIHNAWITGLNYSTLDATNGAILFETMTLTHEGLSVFFTNDAGTTAADGTALTSF